MANIVTDPNPGYHYDIMTDSYIIYGENGPYSISRNELMMSDIPKGIFEDEVIKGNISPSIISGIQTELDASKKRKIFTQAESDNINRVKEKAILEMEKEGRIHVINDDRFVVAGGMFYSLFHCIKPKDVDIFVLKNNDTDNLYNIYKQSVSWSQRDEKYHSMNDRILAVFNSRFSSAQVIFTDYETRQELISSFDYAHCCCHIHKDKLYINRKTYNAIIQNKLVVNNKSSVCEWREQKFLSMGMTLA